MNKKRLAAFLFALLSFAAFAQEDAEKDSDKKSPNSFSLIVEFAYHPEFGRTIGSGERFSWFKGPFDGAEFGVTGAWDYIVPLPGNSALTQSNNAKFGADLQISPATIKPHFFISCSPVAFLDFHAGATFGTGWEFMGAQGLASYNAVSGNFDNLTPFQNWFYEFELGGTFQFDAAAIWPGDWHHIVFLASYNLRWSGMTGQADGHPWIWAADFPKVNGANYYSNIILGYQMPGASKLGMFGVMAEFEGFYSSSQIAAAYRAYDIDFCRINISPVLVFNFTKKDSLFALFYFERRRGFDSAKGYVNGREQSDVELRCSGGEWHFRRIALRYIHKF